MSSWRSFSWFVGKLLQILGLLSAGYALYVGLSTNNSRQELALLGTGVIEFVCGLLLLKFSAGIGT